ncbi:hypothetical protein D9C73_004587 [Collichthys lucidus]|uniref:Uncharacterized protein n=1 Tax=Collichthys lucidus TaxID=240159 RepID=A0A4U5U9F7_COLLU|nr:hypothetical protein D9C73_004587 [Collichthys lucidus]
MLPQKLFKIKPEEEVSDEDMDTAQSAAEMAVRMATEAGWGSCRRAGEGNKTGGYFAPLVAMATAMIDRLHSL